MKLLFFAFFSLNCCRRLIIGAFLTTPLFTLLGVNFDFEPDFGDANELCCCFFSLES